MARAGIWLGCAIWLALAASAPAEAAQRGTAGLCPPAGATAPMLLAPGLARPAARALGLELETIQRGAFYRCSEGRLWVCALGRDRSCSKANVEVKPASVAAFCARLGAAAKVPVAVAGRNALYRWACRAGEAKALTPALALDADGYLTDAWRELR